MERFAELVTRHPRVILGAAVVLSAAAVMALPLDYDDDVVRFLPAEDPEVRAFERIAERFGSLNVALIAVESPALYSHDHLTYVRAVTRAIRDRIEVEHVTSITELAVVRAEEGEAVHIGLVPDAIPTAAAALAAIRDGILELDYIAGGLASEDGTAALLIAQLRTRLPDGRSISSKRAAEAVKAVALGVPPPDGAALHFGGAPFIAEAAANGSQDDLMRLAPFVGGITLLLIILSLASFWAALYTVLAVGLGILWTLGLMGWLGAPLTLVSTSLPVILVALGSAYAVHVLVWYREHGADARGTVIGIGWPVVITALTTAAGFLSFLVMDLAPMREFGWQMAVGACVCALLALTVVPALLVIRPVRPRTRSSRAIDGLLLRMARATRRRRAWVLGVAGLAAVGLATQLADIDTRMDTGSFFEEDSAPARADRLLAEKFGGSVYLQVLVDADVRDPAVLHRLAAFEDRLMGVEGVTRTESIAKVLAIVHEGLKEVRRPSRSRDEIDHLGFLARRADPAVSLLVDPLWHGALVQVGIGGFDTGVVDRITAEIRALARDHLAGLAVELPRGAPEAASFARDAAERVIAVAGASRELLAPVQEALAGPLPQAAVDAVVAATRGVVERELVELEMLELADPAAWPALANALAGHLVEATLDRATLAAALEDRVTAADRADLELFERGVGYLATRLEIAAAPLIRAAARDRLAPLLGDLETGRWLRIEAIVDEALQPTVYTTLPAGSAAPSGARPVEAIVSGQPVIQRAMTLSVQRNQAFSLMVSLPLVLLILWLVFRSFVAGLIGVLPAGLTLLVTFGLMGLFPEHLPMDLAASMLASIALGVGIDYAIHFTWRYRQGGLEAAMRTTGRAILINAGEITCGFMVLAWATIAPMSRFGILTAVTLFVAALATLVLLPPLLSWWRGPSPAPSLHETAPLQLDTA